MYAALAARGKARRFWGDGYGSRPRDGAGGRHGEGKGWVRLTSSVLDSHSPSTPAVRQDVRGCNLATGGSCSPAQTQAVPRSLSADRYEYTRCCPNERAALSYGGSDVSSQRQPRGSGGCVSMRPGSIRQDSHSPWDVELTGSTNASSRDVVPGPGFVSSSEISLRAVRTRDQRVGLGSDKSRFVLRR
jgi:hypothetical protein